MPRIPSSVLVGACALAVLSAASAGCGDDSSDPAVADAGGAGASDSGADVTGSSGGSGIGGAGVDAAAGVGGVDGSADAGASGAGGFGGASFDAATGGNAGGGGEAGMGGKGGGSDGGTLCIPGAATGCFDGPVGTENIGMCKPGTKLCAADGNSFGPCEGQVLPASEDCATPVDDDCDGTPNDGCSAKASYSADVQPVFQAKCAPCHTQFGSGGANLASSYASTQLSSYSCSGKTKGACAIVRIQNGSMPPGAGCTGNPALDATNPHCVTASEQAIIQAWIDGGQPED